MNAEKIKRLHKHSGIAMMKKSILVILMICLYGPVAWAQSLTAITYNLRGDDPRDVGNEWAKRKLMVTDQFIKYKPDLIGIQETNANMVGYLMSVLPDIDSIGPLTKVTTGILFNKRRLSLLKHGYFYLSETPDIESKGWDAKFKRICVWGQFKDRVSGLEYYVFNSHFDHIGVVARTMSVKLLLEKSREIAGNSYQILMGDLNTKQYDPNYITINNSGIFKDCYDLAINNHEKERGTGNGFNIHRRQRIRVDHIFLSDKLQAFEYDVLTGLYNHHTTSDHYAVISIIGPKTTDLGDMYRQFPEDFENITPVVMDYGNNKVKARTGEWFFKGAILGGVSADDQPTSGTYAARLTGNNPKPVFLQMNFDVPDGASKVTVQYGVYGTDSVSRWQLEYSTNQGRSWFPTGPTVVSHQGNKQQAMFIMDIKGKVRFRINKFGGTGNNGRLSIDDINIYKRLNTGAEKRNIKLLAWQFPQSSGNPEESKKSSFNAKGVSPSVLNIGPGLKAVTANQAPLQPFNGLAALTKAPVIPGSSDTTSAIAGETYFEFEVSPAHNSEVCLETLDIRIMASGSKKKNWYWKYSLDGKTFKFLAKPFEFAEAFASSQTTVNLSVQPELQHLNPGQQVYFRLYIAGLESDNDIIGIGSSQVVSDDYPLILTGSVQSKK